MRLFKEAGSLIAVALLGGMAGWWAVDLFGMPATCELLKYGGTVAGLFFLVLRRLNAAFDQGTSLAEFDALTREQFTSALQSYRKRFWTRMALGLLLAIYAAGVGVLVGKSTTVNHVLAYTLTLTATGTLLAAAAMVATQLWVSSWPSEYIAGIRRLATDQKNRRDAFASYTTAEEHPL